MGPGPAPDFISFVPTPLRLDMARGDMVRDIGAGRKTVPTHISGGIRAKVGRGYVDDETYVPDSEYNKNEEDEEQPLVPTHARLDMARGDIVRDIGAGRKIAPNHISAGFIINI